MRIMDWSSDVCSSDLAEGLPYITSTHQKQNAVSVRQSIQQPCPCRQRRLKGTPLVAKREIDDQHARRRCIRAFSHRSNGEKDDVDDKPSCREAIPSTHH